MNFLIFGHILDFSEFEIDLFDFYFRAGDMPTSGASKCAINHDCRSSL